MARQCTHVRKGIVTNQPGEYTSSQPHASRQCCDREPCLEAARTWVQGITGQPAFYVPDSPEWYEMES